MPYTYTPDLSLFTEAFTQTGIRGLNWIIPVFIIFLTMILITRDPNKWKILLLPTTIAWRVAGLQSHYLLVIIGVILFVQESLSLEILGQVITATSGFASDVKSKIQKTTSFLTERTIKNKEWDKKFLDKIDKFTAPKKYEAKKAQETAIIQLKKDEFKFKKESIKNKLEELERKRKNQDNTTL